MAHLVSDVKTEIIRQFGDDSGAQLLDADFIRWVNNGQLEIFRGTEENEQTYTVPTVVGTDTYAMPANFFKFISVYFGGTFLAKSSRRLVNQFSPNAPVGNAAPQYHYRKGSNLVLYPPPDTVANLVVEYQARPVLIANLSDPLSISDAFWNTMLTYCLAQAKQLDGDMGAYNGLMAEVNGRLTRDYADSKDPYDDYYPFVTTISEGW